MQRFRAMLGRLVTLTVILYVVSASLWADTIVVEENGSILLPAERLLRSAIQPDVQRRMSNSRRWRSFIEDHGSWSVQWNQVTGTPHRAYGPAIQIPGYTRITSENVRDAAMAFLSQNSSLLGINPDELTFVRATGTRDRWYVTFRQTKEGIEVLLSEVELRIFANGNVVAFGSDFYKEISVSTTPSISYESAKQMAVEGLDVGRPDDKVYGEGKLFILPVTIGEAVEHHLVYEVFVETTVPVGRYVAYVDTHNGEIVWRHNRVRYAEVNGRVSGMVQLVLPTDPFVERDFFDQYVAIGGVQVRTDSLGKFAREITSPTSLTASLSGPWVNVDRQDGTNASISMTVNPGDSVNILWDDGNAHPAERDAFYHTNIVHNFITTLDTQFTNINYSMPCAVNINNTCNAFWDGTGINFYRAGGGCPNTAQMPDVVYHEYGHGINDKLYEQLGSGSGMINGATHEGLADVIAALIMDDSRVGRGFFGVGTVLRNLNNTNRYPDNLNGESHNDGLIIGGAFWDLRQVTSLETARHLSHFAKYGLPDDPNTAVAFSEWYVEVLFADDDDGNLSNGTPHFAEINNSFNLHGIGSSLFMQLSFSHTPLPDTQDTLNVYSAIFGLQGIGVMGGAPDSVFLHYSTDNFQTTASVQATRLIGDQYRADIPAQSSGAIVEYFVTAYDPLGNASLRIPFSGAFSFLVGFNTVLLDELEVESGWVVGAPDDNATTGIWERVDPQATSIGSQPEDDHTAAGTDCYVTDGRNDPNNAGAFDVDNGKTTLFTPIFDLSALENPAIRYYKWYSNNKGATPGTDFWVVHISNDSGQTWVNVENTNVSTEGWEKFQFRVSDYVAATSVVLLRFVASDFGAGSLVEGLVDDFEILETGAPTSVEGPKDGSELPRSFALYQNYPNPFNPSTRITYTLPKESNVALKIYNSLGQELRTLVNESQTAGRKTVQWDGKNARGLSVSSGVYVYRLQAGNEVRVKKMLFLR